MFLAVLGVMDKYNAVWAALTAIADMVSRLGDLTDTIQEKSGVQGTRRTGIAGGKRRKRMEMMEQSATIAGDLHALAVKNGDDDMQARADFELSDLVRMGETVIAPRCQEVHNLANTNAAALADFGTTAADIAALQTAINEFTALVTKPREAIGERKEATGDIAENEDAADALLKNELDKAMRKFKKKNAPFFSEYTSARMIIDLGTRHETPDNPPGPTPTPPGPK